MQALQRGTDIVVATPGRLIDHMQRRTIDLSAVEILTLDEADRMLDMGFLPALRRVLPALPRARQTLLFSATLSDGGRAALRASSRASRGASTSRTVDVVAPTVTHRMHPVAHDRKGDVADARPDAGPSGSGAGLLQDQARLGPRRRAPRAGRRQGGGHSRQQEPGRPQSCARRLQGRAA